MVLWEIALGTAYFLGLKRTYRHALRIQRRLVSPNHPKIRQFLHSKTRTVFDVTLKIQNEVQKRDFKIGRNFGSWIRSWIDGAKPAAAAVAQIEAAGTQYASNTIRMPNQRFKDFRHQITSEGFRYLESRRRMITSSRNLRLTAYPTVAKLLRRGAPFVSNMQYRRLVYGNMENKLGFGYYY
ncbi:uncharacterized protein [Rutidosis leptorrhynchoides]|uniref:uncharacterized protein n=1 Tax=Rutidosis leptorrhynchoides TaxID=125765 RepID=UPI003A98E6DB